MMNACRFAILLIMIGHFCTHRQVTAWFYANHIEHRNVGDMFSFFCDGISANLNDGVTVISEVAFYTVNETDVELLLSCSQKGPDHLRPEVKHWNVTCKDLVSTSSRVPNGHRFNLSVSIPHVAVTDENHYACKVTNHLNNAPGVDTSFMMSVVHLYVQEPPESNPCADPDHEWHHYRTGKVCVGLFEEKLPVIDASMLCTEIFEGHLVVIQHEQYEHFIDSLIRIYPDSDQAFWIGLSDEKKENTFEWEGGIEMTYKNWARRRPMNDTKLNCVLKGQASSGGWTDVSCEEEHHVMCEIDLEKDEEKKDIDPEVAPDNFDVIILSFVSLTLIVLLTVCIMMALPQGLCHKAIGDDDIVDEGSDDAPTEVQE